MLTVVEFYKPWWSNRSQPDPLAFTNRNAALKAAAAWASKLAVDQLGTFKVNKVSDDPSSWDFVIVYSDTIGEHVEEVALLFDVAVVHS